MQGLMQDFPLTLPHFFGRAEQLFPDKEVVTATATGIERTTYGEWADAHPPPRRRARRPRHLATTAGSRRSRWNTARHLELYFAAPCTGRVLHTLNIRLFPEQLTYIVNHAEDEVIFVDRSLVGAAVAAARPTFETVRHLVVMDDGKGDVPDGPTAADRSTTTRSCSPRPQPVEFHVDDENRAASMCYTSGTTGNPKGVVYSHRSTFLHTMGAMTADGIGARESRRDPAGGADVPRQRVGPRPRRRRVRRRPRDARPRPVGQGDRRPDRGRAGHGRRRRADDLDGRAARARRVATRRACGRSRAAARRCRGRCRRRTASSSACRSCRRGG